MRKKSKQLYSLCDYPFWALMYLILFWCQYVFNRSCLVWTVQYIWLLLFENNCRNITLQEWHWWNSIVTVIARDRLVDDNFKRQIKNRTLHTCRLFLLTWTFRYISNSSNVFELLFAPFLQHFFIYHSWYTSNFESVYKKPPIIKVAILMVAKERQ